jgi:hypothetical protein
MTPSTAAAATRLVVLYGIGGLSDVGRHAILAALEQHVSKVTVITEYPELLDEQQWECGCTPPHTNPAKEFPDRVEVISLESSWKTTNHVELLKQHMTDANAVISCLGHRQPGYKYPILRKKGIISYKGNIQVIQAMKEMGVERAVVISSIGIEEDYPPLELHWAGNIMNLLFRGPAKKTYADLTNMEREYKASAIDYLFVRPVGISEDVVPENRWFIQKEKGVDPVGFNMAKMDVARFMVEEALNPTKHRMGVVIGSEPPRPKKKK